VQDPRPQRLPFLRQVFRQGVMSMVGFSLTRIQRQHLQIIVEQLLSERPLLEVRYGCQVQVY